MALWLSEADVRAVLSMPDLINAIETAVAAFSSGRVIQPVRTVLDTPAGFFASMPAFLGSVPAMGAKLVTVFHDNPSHGLPSHLATILLLDPNNGGLLAAMDGRYITEARTGAASAVATRYLAREESTVLAIIGSGVQAHSHLEALSLVRKFHEVRVWSPNSGNLKKFAADHGTVRAAASAEEAVRDADVVVLVTASNTPVIENAWVKLGACVISVGACRPTQREMDPVLVARGRLVVDTRAAALKESGDVVHGIREGRFGEDHIVAELGQVVSDPKLGRTSPDEITIFKSLGMAVEDVAAADLVYRRAIQMAKGVAIG